MLTSLVATAGRPKQQRIKEVHSMLKESYLVGIVVVMDTVLKTVPSQETSPILKRERNCGRAQEMLNQVVGVEEETVTIDKMVAGMDAEEVVIIMMALITRTLVPAVLTEKSLLNKEKTHTKKINGATWHWCGRFSSWTKTHGTVEHRSKSDSTDDANPQPIAPTPGTTMQDPAANITELTESANQVDLPFGATAYSFG